MSRNSQAVLLILLFTVLLGFNVTPGQTLFPMSGGTSIETHPMAKGEAVLVAENEELRILLGRSPTFNSKYGNVWAIWIRVFNKGKSPIDVDPMKFTAKETDGRALEVLAPETAVKRFSDDVSPTVTALSNVLLGPSAGRNSSKAAERRGTSKLLSDSFYTTSIAPSTYKEGLVFFERSPSKETNFQIMIGELWTEPFNFTSVGNQKLKLK